MKTAKIDHIVSIYPNLSAHRDMVEFILDLREAFNLEEVPLEIQIGEWSSGSLNDYYAKTEADRLARIKAKELKRRKANREKYRR